MDNGEANQQKHENRPAAVLVRPDAERDADGRSEKRLHRGQNEHLGAREIPLAIIAAPSAERLVETKHSIVGIDLRCGTGAA